MPRSDDPPRKIDGDADPSQEDFQVLENFSTAYWQSEVLFSALEQKTLRPHRKRRRDHPKALHAVRVPGGWPLSSSEGDEADGTDRREYGLWFNSQAARRYLVTKSPSYMGDFFLYRRAMQDNFRLMTQKISLNAASEATRREDSDSPIHWQKPQGKGPAKRVNDYLVKMFERLLKNAEALEGMADRESVMKDIETEIDRQIFFEQL